MPKVKRLLLDILKPHHPNPLEFGRILAEQGAYRIQLRVLEMDENTESMELVIEGENIDFERIQSSIAELGGSLHSIDEVEVLGEAVAGGEVKGDG